MLTAGFAGTSDKVIVTLTSFSITDVSTPVCCAHITAVGSSILMWIKPHLVPRYTGAPVKTKQTAMGTLFFPFELNWNKPIVNPGLQ